MEVDYPSLFIKQKLQPQTSCSVMQQATARAEALQHRKSLNFLPAQLQVLHIDSVPAPPWAASCTSSLVSNETTIEQYTMASLSPYPTIQQLKMTYSKK